MARYRGTDTTPVAAGAALGTVAVVGAMQVASEAAAHIGRAYGDHIRAGGEHIPEMLLIAYALLGWLIGYVGVSLAGDFGDSGKVHHTPTLVTVIGLLIWFFFIGGICANLVMAGKGALFNAILPIGAAVLAAQVFGTTGWTTFGVWLVARIVCAAMSEIALYRGIRMTVLGAMTLALWAAPIVIHFGWISRGLAQSIAKL